MNPPRSPASSQAPPAFDNGDSLRDFEVRLRSALFLLKAQPEMNEPLKLTGTVTAVVQPVVRTADRLIVGYEALARMPALPERPPDWWLARAEDGP